MQYSVILSVLAAAGAIALPTEPAKAGKETTVLLKGDNVAAWLATGFPDNQDGVATDHQLRTFKTAELSLAKDAHNKDLRCQLKDGDDNRIIVTRGTSIDFTLGDGDKGEWKLKKPSVVKTVTCSPKFKKTDPNDVNVVKVILDNDPKQTLVFSASDVATGAKKMITMHPNGNSQVEVNVGPGIENQGLRCAVIDVHDKQIPLQRGTSKESTAGDQGKGPWTFRNGPTETYSVLCSPDLKKA